MKNRKSEAFTQGVVGVFMLTVLLLMGYFTIVISGVDVLSGRHRVPVRVAFSQVGGLKDRDNVMYRGTKVGVVERVEVTPSNLVVTARIDSNVILREGYSATVCSLSMLGGTYLRLDEGEGESLDLETTLFRGVTPTDWMEDLRQIASTVNGFVSGPEIGVIVTNAVEASEKAREFAEDAKRMADDVKAFIDKANHFADKAVAVADRVERGEGMVGKLLSSDDTVYDDFKETVANAKEISAKVNRDKVFDDLEAGIAAFRKAAEEFDAKGMSEKGAALLADLGVVAERLKNGEGTLGRLSNDTELYDEVKGLMKDVREVVDNYRDTTPISTFTSLATGAL
ncbi:MAG: MCE family protein [Kiritimatiellae bacterium]|nr:MCE family protein [Kiritimatiellia bacterium]